LTTAGRNGGVRGVGESAAAAEVAFFFCRSIGFRVDVPPPSRT
jgi:hypothetical protein